MSDYEISREDLVNEIERDLASGKQPIDCRLYGTAGPVSSEDTNWKRS